jgi:hypothetical protein
MNYPDWWPCECGATKATHEALKILGAYLPLDNLTYVERVYNEKNFKNKIKKQDINRGIEDNKEFVKTVHRVAKFNKLYGIDRGNDNFK